MTNRIVKGSYTGPIGIGSSVVIPIYIAIKEAEIKSVQISAPSLNKSTDQLNITLLSKKAITPADDIDIMGYWTNLASDSHPGGNYMVIKSSLEMYYEDDETVPTPDAGEGAIPGRWVWLKVENKAGNSSTTPIEYRISIGNIE